MDRQELLRIARDSLESAFEGSEADYGTHDERYGAFVTLRKHGNLRGCIGYMEGIYPIEKQIAVLAREAAFDDFRFPQLTEDELGEITIEISILTPFRPISSYEEFQPGRDGIIMEKDNHRAVFLPQVAEETGWTRDEMLKALSVKAGLSPDAYLSHDAEFMIFQAEVFSEDDL